jgi:hypothetical protein
MGTHNESLRLEKERMDAFLAAEFRKRNLTEAEKQEWRDYAAMCLSDDSGENDSPTISPVETSTEIQRKKAEEERVAAKKAFDDYWD